MTRTSLARLHRLLRRRIGRTQAEHALRAGVGRWAVVQIEAAAFDRLRLSDIERSFDSLGCRIKLGAFYRGAAAERLLDEAHAALVGAFVEVLRRYRWDVRVEVSFSEWGERGSIDILGWQPRERALLVVEVKSELGGLDATLRPLDVKTRLAASIARGLGWRTDRVSRIVVLPEQSTARRAVQRHASALDASLPGRARELRRWLVRPRGTVAGVWFLSIGHASNNRRQPRAHRSTKRARPRSGAPSNVAGSAK